jgi:hypothetical protein
MDQHFGPGYSKVWAESHVMSELGSRTAVQALGDGIEPKMVWRAILANQGLPASMR